MKIALGADHGGVAVKEAMKAALELRGVQIDDLGCHGPASVDYPDYARAVASRVSRGEADQGLLVCTTGIGMAIMANKFPRVRAALCLTPDAAGKARMHNDANVLVLPGQDLSPDGARAILDAWLRNGFSGAERHRRRVDKIGAYAAAAQDADAVFEADPEVYDAIERDVERQESTLVLIASENYASRAVRQCQGSVMTNKYAEGYPGRRWYNGCEHVDTVERLAIERAKALFGAEHANVQSHAGSAANLAVYFSVLQPGDTILAMSLAHGGHLTHGHRANFSGRLFHIVSYGVRRDTEEIDFDEAARLAEQHRPKLIVAGASAYPRVLDFARFREIADRVGARLVVDMAHIAGLVAGGAHPSPVPHAEFVTSTTHKTLRGPRSGFILCRQAFAEEVDRQVFPGLQGGPQMHVVAAKAVCFREAAAPSFRRYAAQVVANARALAGALREAGLRLISGGTDNHLMLIDVAREGWTGKDAAEALEAAGIIANKNVIPFETQSPMVTSGVRLGTPAVTTRGMCETEMEAIAGMVIDVLRGRGDPSATASVRGRVADLTARFPVP